MKIALIGASGEIGSYIFRYFKKENIELVPVVRSSLGAVLARWEIKPIFADLNNFQQLICGLKGFDIVINCTINKQNYNSVKDRINKNIEGCKNLLKAAKECGIKKIIHFSSIAVLPPEITDSILAGTNIYSKEKDWYTQVKIETEKIFLNYNDNNNFITVVRPGIVYGPYMTWSRLAFERTSSYDICLPDTGGSCFAVHAYDVAGLIKQIAESEIKFSGIVYAVNPEPVTWKQFYEYHAIEAGINAKINLLPAGNIPTAKERSLLRETINWGFQSPLTEIIGKVALIKTIGKKIKKYTVPSPSPSINRTIEWSHQELAMYKSDASMNLVETGQTYGFSYKINLKNGCKNAALWRQNKYGQS